MRILTSLILSLMLLSCSSLSQDSRSQAPLLYDELGGQQGLERIVDNFIMEIARNERVLPFFADSNVERFRDMVTEHFCMIADGPCEYTGDTMIQVHTGMQINEAEFNAVVENLMTAMDDAGVPIGAQNRLLARLAPLRSEIIHL